MIRIKVAIYARVSTLDQQDLDNQLKPLNDYVNNKKWELVNIYTDHASGGSTKKRPQFQLMMKDAFEGKFQIVLVWKIDRFARSMQDFAYHIGELDRMDIRFISITQGIDSDKQSPSGRLLMNMMAAFAEFERELIRERINASIATRKAKGEPIGRARVMVNIDEIWELKEKGISIRGISKLLEIDKMVVMRRLKEYGKAKGKVIRTTKEDSEDFFGEVL
jgi:putative DNA-invertase from lambdoid prophage Rac